MYLESHIKHFQSFGQEKKVICASLGLRRLVDALLQPETAVTRPHILHLV
jgi:hypothetical protein